MNKKTWISDEERPMLRAAYMGGARTVTPTLTDEQLEPAWLAFAEREYLPSGTPDRVWFVTDWNEPDTRHE
jgi:hypothetical protein